MLESLPNRLFDRLAEDLLALLTASSNGPNLAVEPTDTSQRAVPAAGTALAAVVARRSGIPGPTR